jgi:hypothetical protein
MPPSFNIMLQPPVRGDTRGFSKIFFKNFKPIMLQGRRPGMQERVAKKGNFQYNQSAGLKL